MKKSSILLLLFLPCLVFAQNKPTRTSPVSKPAVQRPIGKIIVNTFSDFLYVVQDPQTAAPSKGTDGRNELLVRRAVIGYEYSFTNDVSVLLTYDAGSATLHQANVSVRNLVTQLDMKMGKMLTMATETVEKVWHYRSLEQTMLDRTGLTDEFDNGVVFTGRTDAAGSMYARLAVYNGTGGAETDKLKKFGLSIGNWFDRSTILEVYADYENVGMGRSTITGKALYGMVTPTYAFGVEGFYRMNRKFAGINDVTPAGGSLFTWFELDKALRAVARIDVMDNDLSNSNAGFRDVYVNAGIDYLPTPDVHLIPNIVYGKQLKKGSTVVNADVIIVRLTAAVALASLR